MSAAQTLSMAGLRALARRAESLSKTQGLAPQILDFWRGYAKALQDLQMGVGEKLAAKDSAAQHPTSMRQSADAALPVDGHDFAAADVPEFVATKNVQVADHLVVDFKVNAVHQLEHDELIAFVPNDKQAVLVVDSDNVSARHESSGVVAGSMAQRHNTAAKPESVKGTGGAA
jgi:hypothetical protein